MLEYCVERPTHVSDYLITEPAKAESFYSIAPGTEVALETTQTHARNFRQKAHMGCGVGRRRRHATTRTNPQDIRRRAAETILPILWRKESYRSYSRANRPPIPPRPDALRSGARPPALLSRSTCGSSRSAQNRPAFEPWHRS